MLIEKSCFEMFPKLHRKITLPESLCKSSCRPTDCNFIKNEICDKAFQVNMLKLSKEEVHGSFNSFCFWVNKPMEI